MTLVEKPAEVISGSRATDPSLIRNRKDLNWILALTIAPLLLFIQKPFHIDDSAFLEVAQNILSHPFDPFHGTVAMVDNDFHVFRSRGFEPNTFESMSHPPLVSYVMAAVIKIAGGTAEAPLHVMFLIFPIMVAIASLSLAERFTKIPRYAVFFFVVSPIFLLNAQSLMTDTPMLAFMLSSLAFFIYGTDHNKTSFLIYAGILAGLAMLTRYVAFLILPVFVSYSVLKQKGGRPVVIAGCCALAVFAIWLAENFVSHGTAHITASFSFYRQFYPHNQKTTLVKSVCDFAALGGLSIPLAFYIASVRKSNLRYSLGSAILVAVLLLLLMKTRSQYLAGYTTINLFTLFIFITAGLYLLAEAVSKLLLSLRTKQDPQKEDTIFLFIWISVMLITAIFVLPFGTARYVLPVLFPLILIVTNHVNANLANAHKLLARVCIVLTFILSLILSIADTEYALTYKTFARNIKEMYPNERIWFIGEWGFRFYMKEQGATYLLSTDTSPAPNDLIIKAGIAGLHEMNDSLKQKCIVFDPYVVNTPDPVRVLNTAAKAGFYSHGFGLFPFTLSNKPLETFDMCRILGPTEKALDRPTIR